MTLLPWVWFAAGTLVGSVLLASLAWLWVKSCRRSSDRVRVIRLAHLGLLAVLFLQLFGWWPRLEFARPAAPRAEVATVGAYGLAAPVESLAPVGVAVWPAAVWFGGTIAFTSLFVARRVRLNLLRQLPEYADIAVRERVATVATRLGIARPPVTLVGRAGCSPFVFGVVHPILVLPPDFKRLLSPAQQEAVLAHEIAHLVGRDPLWIVLGEMVITMMWWNPLAWWMVAKHRTTSELVADDATLVLADGPGLLAESLFVLAGRLMASHPAPASAVGSRCRSALVRRVRRLLAVVPPPASQNRFGLLVQMGIAGGIAVVVLSGMTLMRATGGQSGASFASQLWNARGAPSPAAGAHIPKTLGDLHPELRTDPENVDLAGYRLEVVRVDAEGRTKPTDAAAPATEAEAFAHIDVSAEQREKLLAIQAERWEETKTMYRGPVGERVSRGMEINRRWHAGLRTVLTDDQYRRYLEFWRDRPVVAVRLPDQKVRSRGH